MTFEEFLAAELTALRRYSRVLTGDRDTAHDILTEALIKAQLRWSRIRQLAFPAAYVRAMVTNGYLSEKRSTGRRQAREVITATSQPSGSNSVEDRDHLDSLLRALPRQQCAALVLRYYLDLPDQDIAAELRCSAGAVRTYVARGLATIREREGLAPRVAPTPRQPGPAAHLIGEIQ